MSNVTHPTHYNSGKIEVIEAIEDWKLGFHRGNAIKYIARAGKKDPAKEIEDLEKADWYIQREIERLKAAKDGRDPVRPNDMNPRATPLDTSPVGPTGVTFTAEEIARPDLEAAAEGLVPQAEPKPCGCLAHLPYRCNKLKSPRSKPSRCGCACHYSGGEEKAQEAQEGASS